MYKIGVIGDRESVLGFKAVGLDVFPTDDPSEARKSMMLFPSETASFRLSKADWLRVK